MITGPVCMSVCLSVCLSVCWLAAHRNPTAAWILLMAYCGLAWDLKEGCSKDDPERCVTMGTFHYRYRFPSEVRSWPACLLLGPCRLRMALMARRLDHTAGRHCHLHGCWRHGCC